MVQLVGIIWQELMDLYARENINVLVPTEDELHKIKTMSVKPVLADIADTKSGKRELWQKQDTIRHNPDLIAQTLLDIMKKHQSTESSDPKPVNDSAE